MLALDRCSRALVASAAFAAFGGAFVTAPMTARGAAELALPNAVLAAPVPTPSALAVVLPQRDPFAGEAAPNGNAPPRGAASGAAAGAPAAMTAPSFALGPLPPNAGAGSAPFPFAAQTARVTAVITGPNPFALVDDMGTTRLLTRGDVLAGSTIASITAAGIRLDDGRTLAVAAAQPAPQPTPGSPPMRVAPLQPVRETSSR